jgi:arylsulfatase A-like enzyme
VESFLYSPLLPSSVAGSHFYGLFHVSDWFPTIASLAGADFAPVDSSKALDGYDQLDSLVNGADHPRVHLLYNYYLADESSDLWTNAPAAVRDGRYKLMHTYNSSTAGRW